MLFKVFAREGQRTPSGIEVGVDREQQQTAGRSGMRAALGWARDVGVGVAVTLVSRSSAAFRVRALWHVGSLLLRRCVVMHWAGR
jgi:hypothetical protein